MESQAIRIYARIRPEKSNSHIHNNQKRGCIVALDGPTSVDNEPQLHFTIPKQDAIANNTREQFGFRFDKVFDAYATQEEIFDGVAKDVVDSVLSGFNATVFAYGQTGSGKTFTITGGPAKYADRGIIPRSIQRIFQKVRSSVDREYSISVSYLEIYNEIGYDLLDEARDAKKLEDLSRVTIREEEDRVVLASLSSHPVLNEEEALNWLFVGDTNKMISETPSNPSSSRSHCIFIITITSCGHGDDSAKRLRAKLHLVDLAGSERVAKTKIDGTLLKEAKHINLSLHYLEQVIVALHEKALGKRSHVPYRNSMMTSVLRDSLGGNCMTTMIATIAVEDHLVEESISTCRFAQRVALISNSVSLNEEEDPDILIDKLRAQVAQLKSELALAKGQTEDQLAEQLKDYEIVKCHQCVDAYIENESSKIQFSDYRCILECFKYFKTLCSKTNVNLNAVVSQRDTEIGVLVSMVNKLKGNEKKVMDKFQKSYEPMNEIEEQRSVLKLKYAEAKQLGIDASKLRDMIKQLKENSADSALSIDREEIRKLTQEYKIKYNSLKELKTEVDHLQHLHNLAKARLNSDFTTFIKPKDDINAFYMARSSIQ